jgi:hypothetical protein
MCMTPQNNLHVLPLLQNSRKHADVSQMYSILAVITLFLRRTKLQEITSRVYHDVVWNLFLTMTSWSDPIYGALSYLLQAFYVVLLLRWLHWFSYRRYDDHVGLLLWHIITRFPRTQHTHTRINTPRPYCDIIRSLAARTSTRLLTLALGDLSSYFTRARHVYTWD